MTGVISLGSNISSLKAQGRLGEVSAEISSVYEKLASGQRINRASDDAAGLAIASSLQVGRRVFDQGVRNLNDGISLTNVADSAIEQLGSILVRLRELTEQAANGTYGVKQRKSLDAEAQALAKEYVRIAQSTSFNGRQLLAGSFGDLRLQGSFGVNGGIQGNFAGAVGTGRFDVRAGATEGGTAVTLGDINGDGIMDLVTANYQISVRLGNGDGSFGVSRNYGHGNMVALGDIDGDGCLDIIGGISQAYGTSRISISLGNGNGTFGAETFYSLDSPLDCLAVGDIDGDGKMDIVGAGSYAEYNGAYGYFPGRNAIVSMLGNGNGSFRGPITTALGGVSHSSITLGDLNGDGLLDVAVGTYYYTNDGRAEVLMSKGDGTFWQYRSYRTSTVDVAPKVALGDMNNDGILDLVTGDDSAGNNGYLQVRLGRGGGSLGNPLFADTTIAITTPVSSIALGDLDGDGILDIVASGSLDLGLDGIRQELTICIGRGNGTYQQHTTIPAANEPGPIALGDLNGDGVLDVASVGYSAGDVFLNRTTSGVSALLPFKLDSLAGALQAMDLLTQAQNRLATQRGVIGAFQSRIGVAISVLQSSSENYAAAASRIRDADISAEGAQLVRTQILQQAAAAVLAQSNQQPALALNLLGG